MPAIKLVANVEVEQDDPKCCRPFTSEIADALKRRMEEGDGLMADDKFNTESPGGMAHGFVVTKITWEVES